VAALSPLAHADDDMVGLNPGDKAPDFSLKNQDGKEVKLSELLNKGNVALVFYRSADW
jgi:peroxiredoxin